MNRLPAASVAALFALAACGGGESGGSSGTASQGGQAAASAAPAAGAMTMPSWFKRDGNNVTLDIVAGSTTDNNSWNFNGHFNGNSTITVPMGSAVTLNFSNQDRVNPHSIGVAADDPTSLPAMFNNPQPVFAGAISANPTSMQSATAFGKSETLKFTANKAGDYILVCYIPGHALTGMWIRFKVSASGEAGFSKS